MAFSNHVADLVSAGLHALLGNHLAAGVRALLDALLSHILHASDLALLDFRNPNLLANLDWRALDLDLLAGTRAVHAAAAARIPSPAAWLLDALGDHAAGAL